MTPGVSGTTHHTPLRAKKICNITPPPPPPPSNSVANNLLVCVPTYNEAENITPFLGAVFENSPRETEILVIDDNSPDGTAELVEKIIEYHPGKLHILKRPKKEGLAAAYLAAFDWGLSGNYGIFLEMDADFSHNPKYIPLMLEEMKNHEVVIGSRNVRNGGVEGWSVLRNFISKGGSVYARMVLGCPVKDLTGGFNMWTRSAILRIGCESLVSKGYLFQVEMKYRAWKAGCAIREIPIVFTDRKHGKSKMSKKIFFEALINIWKIKNRDTGNAPVLKQFIKFCLTGGLGTVTNLTLFFAGADKLNLPEIPVSIFCFLIAGTQNYIINHKWSFAANMRKIPLSLTRWASFMGLSLFGLAANIAAMKIIILNFNMSHKFIAQAFGIICGMIINFCVSKFIIFRRKNNVKDRH
jgi:dolichol-phosphate mannosyltransferase